MLIMLYIAVIYILFIPCGVFPTDKMSYPVSYISVKEKENCGGVNLVC